MSPADSTDALLEIARKPILSRRFFDGAGSALRLFEVVEVEGWLEQKRSKSTGRMRSQISRLTSETTTEKRKERFGAPSMGAVGLFQRPTFASQDELRIDNRASQIPVKRRQAPTRLAQMLSQLL